MYVHKFAIVVAAGLVGSAVCGCADNPPVERVLVPSAGNPDAARREYERPKPMPDSARPFGGDLREPPVREEPRGGVGNEPAPAPPADRFR